MTNQITEQFKMISWNCHSIYNKLSHLKVKVYSSHPHVVCLCETWIKNDRLPKFINYKTYYVNRPASSGGGIAILVRSDLQCVGKSLAPFPNGRLEIQALKIVNGRQHIDIMNVYNPNLTISTNEFQHYFNQLGASRIVVGDFNAHHELWDTRHDSNCPNGRNLVDAIFESQNLNIITPLNLPTYHHIQNNTYSTLDLVLVSNDLYQISSSSLYDDLGSDHMPVLTSISFTPHLTKGKKRPKWIFNPSNWQVWVQQLPEVSMAGGIGSIESAYNSFASNILSTSENVFKQTKEDINQQNPLNRNHQIMKQI